MIITIYPEQHTDTLILVSSIDISLLLKENSTVAPILVNITNLIEAKLKRYNTTDPYIYKLTLTTSQKYEYTNVTSCLKFTIFLLSPYMPVSLSPAYYTCSSLPPNFNYNLRFNPTKQQPRHTNIFVIKHGHHILLAKRHEAYF